MVVGRGVAVAVVVEVAPVISHPMVGLQVVL